MKKAFLITFSKTVRVICEGDEPSEEELMNACIEAQETMPEAGIYSCMDKCVEDTENPYDPSWDE